MPLTNEERLILLRIARDVVERGAAGMKEVSQELYRDAYAHPALAEPRGAFVTLKLRGALRGCIGYVEPHEPLARAVAENALGAATRDHRFPSVEPWEVPVLRIDVSALTPLRPLASVEDIRIGEHGLLVTFRGRRGVLLPQVAVEHGLTPEEFVKETCRKAGLAPDAHLRGATVEVFGAEVFGEEDHA
jgi:AmmeMemoRadiSam system protein A